MEAQNKRNHAPFFNGRDYQAPESFVYYCSLEGGILSNPAPIDNGEMQNGGFLDE